MYHNGYIMVDCGGLELNSAEKQTIDGIYERGLEALATGKPILAVNCVMSEAPCSPFSVVAWPKNGGIIATGHVLRLAIDSDDGVTVTNLVST